MYTILFMKIMYMYHFCVVYISTIRTVHTDYNTGPAVSTSFLDLLSWVVQPCFTLQSPFDMNGNEAPLILASWYSNLQTVCELTENESLDVNVSDISGSTPFYCACTNNHFHVDEKLVNHPNINHTIQWLHRIQVWCEDRLVLSEEKQWNNVAKHRED